MSASQTSEEWRGEVERHLERLNRSRAREVRVDQARLEAHDRSDAPALTAEQEGVDRSCAESDDADALGIDGLVAGEPGGASLQVRYGAPIARRLCVLGDDDNVACAGQAFAERSGRADKQQRGVRPPPFRQNASGAELGGAIKANGRHVSTRRPDPGSSPSSWWRAVRSSLRRTARALPRACRSAG